MIYKIHTGKHRAWPIKLWLWFNKKSITRKVTFDFNCKYDLGNEDQEDHNKLFGIGYLWSHHVDSARFGWRYDNNIERIIISAYCYVDSQRIMVDMCNILRGSTYTISIELSKDESSDFYYFSVSRSGDLRKTLSMPFTHKKKWSFPLGVYFGGNQPAPHDMSIEIKKA